MTISEKAETAGSKEIEAGNEQVYTYLTSVTKTCRIN